MIPPKRAYGAREGGDGYGPGQGGNGGNGQGGPKVRKIWKEKGK